MTLDRALSARNLQDEGADRMMMGPLEAFSLLPLLFATTIFGVCSEAMSLRQPRSGSSLNSCTMDTAINPVPVRPPATTSAITSPVSMTLKSPTVEIDANASEI